MAGISDIVDVVITREQPLPAGASFGWVNFVSAQAAFTPAIKMYGSVEEVTADAQSGADTVAFATLYFGQEVRPTRLYVTKKGAGTYVAALNGALVVNDDWYGVAISSALEADILAVAEWTEARPKIFIAKSAVVDILDDTLTDDLASDLHGLGYNRTALFYHHQAASVHVEAAPFGLQLPKRPGSSQWAYKRLAGVSPSPLTVGARNGALSKNANVYTDRAGTGRFEPGRMVGGEWIDTMIGVDWLSSEIQTRIFFALANEEKIPYTNDGVAVIVNIVKSVLQNAVTNGILAASPEPRVEAPLVENVSKTDKGERLLPDVLWVGTLAGGIIKTKITGRVLI